MNREIEQIVVGDIATNCWIYPFEGKSSGETGYCAVIDPGDEAQSIVSRLEELNLIPAYILLSHGHFDHLAGLPDLIEAFRSGVFASYPVPKVGIHSQDAGYLGKDSLDIHRKSITAAGGSPAFVDALWKDMPDPDTLFEEGDMAGPLKVLHLPGHSPGSAAFYDEKTEVLFSGDTMFKRSWGRTDLPGGDEDLLYKSLKRLLAMNGNITVCPGHGPATTIKNEAGLLV